jgi:hypothetical protein
LRVKVRGTGSSPVLIGEMAEVRLGESAAHVVWRVGHDTSTPVADEAEGFDNERRKRNDGSDIDPVRER